MILEQKKTWKDKRTVSYKAGFGVAIKDQRESRCLDKYLCLVKYEWNTDGQNNVWAVCAQVIEIFI